MCKCVLLPPGCSKSFVVHANGHGDWLLPYISIWSFLDFLHSWDSEKICFQKKYFLDWAFFSLGYLRVSPQVLRIFFAYILIVEPWILLSPLSCSCCIWSCHKTYSFIYTVTKIHWSSICKTTLEQGAIRCYNMTEVDNTEQIL
jgi:hypothetical protein